jgi:hypothetical protein
MILVNFERLCLVKLVLYIEVCPLILQYITLWIISRLYGIEIQIFDKISFALAPAEEFLFCFLDLLAQGKCMQLDVGEKHTHPYCSYLENSKGECAHDREDTPHSRCPPQNTPENHAVLEYNGSIGA